MTIPTDWPIGRLTMRSTSEGVPGEALTTDELAVDVLTAARQCGYDGASPFAVQAMQRVENASEGRLVGTVVLDAGSSAALAVAAERAVAWLNEHAAPGRRFVMRDGLYQALISGDASGSVQRS